MKKTKKSYRNKNAEMEFQWIVVAGQAETKIFEKSSEPKSKMKTINILESPEARAENSELVRHKPGRNVSGGQGKVRGARKYSLSTSRRPREVAADKFAKKVVKYLIAQYRLGKFQNLVLAAEPHFLGKLRSSLKEAIPSTTFVKKDFGKTPTSKLEKQIGAFA